MRVLVLALVALILTSALAAAGPAREWSNALLAQPELWDQRMNGAVLSTEVGALRVEVAPEREWAIAGLSGVIIPAHCGGLRVTVSGLGGGGKWLVRLYGDFDGTGQLRTIGVFQSDLRTGAVELPIDPRGLGGDALAPVMVQLGLEGPSGSWATFAGMDFLPAPKRYPSPDLPGQLSLDVIDWMPNLPEPFNIINFGQKARDYDALVFDWKAEGQFLPLIWLDESKVNYPDPMAGFPSYVGATRTSNVDHESITTMGAVLGATLVGIDKSKQDYDYVAMTEGYYNTANGQQLVLNRVNTTTGGSFWYELFPHIIFYGLVDKYPDHERLAEIMRATAGRWGQAIDALGGDFNHLSFDFTTMKPSDNGLWKEPDSSAALAWLELLAWEKFKEPQYLAWADECMAWLDQQDVNPYYESLLPWGTLAAARMNAELGREYDLPRFVSWCFGISPTRGGWGIGLGKWGDYDAAGLAASVDNRGGYAFAMNTFSQAAALTPVASYDTRFARALGKWMLNLANSARLFYPDQLPSDHQSCWWWKGDPNHCIAYEGLRYEWEGKRPFGMGDPVVLNWGPKTNLGLYGSSYVGLLAALINRTSDERILALDCLATDFFHPQAYPTYLLFNPYEEEREVQFDIGEASCDLYDAATGQWLAKGQSGQARFSIGPDRAVVLVLAPAGAKLATEGERLLADGVVIDWFTTRH